MYISKMAPFQWQDGLEIVAIPFTFVKGIALNNQQWKNNLFFSSPVSLQMLEQIFAIFLVGPRQAPAFCFETRLVQLTAEFAKLSALNYKIH